MNMVMPDSNSHIRGIGHFFYLMCAVVHYNNLVTFIPTFDGLYNNSLKEIFTYKQQNVTFDKSCGYDDADHCRKKII